MTNSNGSGSCNRGNYGSSSRYNGECNNRSGNGRGRHNCNGHDRFEDEFDLYDDNIQIIKIPERGGEGRGGEGRGGEGRGYGKNECMSSPQWEGGAGLAPVFPPYCPVPCVPPVRRPFVRMLIDYAIYNISNTAVTDLGNIVFGLQPVYTSSSGILLNSTGTTFTLAAGKIWNIQLLLRLPATSTTASGTVTVTPVINGLPNANYAQTVAFTAGSTPSLSLNFAIPATNPTSLSFQVDLNGITTTNLTGAVSILEAGNIQIV